MAIDKTRKGDKRGSGRDSGGFVALPWSVLDCPAYGLLSHPARSLLIEFARQHVRDNNGRLLASAKYLSKRGWKSADVIQRAKKELIKAGLIYETVKGHRPNKASWYAITWHNLDKHHGYDAGTYEGWKQARSGYKTSKIEALIPPQEVVQSQIAPSGVVRTALPIPSSGAIKAIFHHLPTPSGGNHLDVPSNKGITYAIPT
jgi:hypothetical protein